MQMTIDRRLFAVISSFVIVSFLGCDQDKSTSGAHVSGKQAGVEQQGIVLVKSVGVDGDLVGMLAAYAQKEWHCAVRIASGSLEMKAGRLQEISNDLMGQRRPGDLCAVLLYSNDTGDLLTAVDGTNGVGAANLGTVMGGAPNPRIKDLRATKESMRCIGLAAGLRPCPFPQCALYKTRDLTELDYKGCNYSPPCQEKMFALLRKKGVDILPTDPRFPSKGTSR